MPPPLRAYLRFLVEQPRLLTFGFALTLFSSFGQTYFIALFNVEIREDFDLSHGEFGLIYSLATLASGISIIWVGSLVDRLDLRVISLLTMIGMAVGALLLSWSPTLLLLPIGLYLLRLCGQGMYGHIAITSMARYFEANRGKAISIASLGYPGGEAIFPLIGVMLIATIGWRESWLVIACVIVLFMIPLVLSLLRGHSERVQAYEAALRRARESDRESSDQSILVRADRQWRRREVLRDRRFFLLLPAILGPAFMATGVFFHQLQLVDERGWEVEAFAAGFMLFAASQVPMGLATGILIDRIGAVRLLPFFLIPFLLGMLTIGLISHPIAIPLFFLFIGMTVGSVGPLFGATWAELYGVEHLGSIRALTTSFMVVSTSLSPFLLGALIDINVSMSAIALGFAGYCVLASVSAGIAVRLQPPPDPE
ncbi:MAG: MFS transporter [Phycisphaerales bacterium]|nr:MAG: MFS transporter [Phycisphaerales bacterium]